MNVLDVLRATIAHHKAPVHVIKHPTMETYILTSTKMHVACITDDEARGCKDDEQLVALLRKRLGAVGVKLGGGA